MNRLPIAKRAHILNLLVEGNSLRAASRIADVSINTVYKLLVDAGEACLVYQDQAFQNLPCKRLQLDEIWSFVYAKEANAPEAKKLAGEAGDIWTWTAIDAETKLVPSWYVGHRDTDAAKAKLLESEGAGKPVNGTTDAKTFISLLRRPRAVLLLVPAKVEPWGQTVSRLLSPEGLLVGVVFTPWMHAQP